MLKNLHILFHLSYTSNIVLTKSNNGIYVQGNKENRTYLKIFSEIMKKIESGTKNKM